MLMSPLGSQGRHSPDLPNFYLLRGIGHRRADPSHAPQTLLPKKPSVLAISFATGLPKIILAVLLLVASAVLFRPRGGIKDGNAKLTLS